MPLDHGKVPRIWHRSDVDEIRLTPDEADQEEELRAFWGKLAAGEVLRLGSQMSGDYAWKVSNLHLSQCFNCDRFAIWLHARLLWPVGTGTIEIADDIPDSCRRDIKEAAAIADISPRGAAALIRLALQSLCAEVGGDGKNINDDIAEFVRQGLDPKIQQALDVVRVFGNNAVHPGELDLRDDRATVSQLFTLFNLVVNAMITQPAMIDAMYEKLPAGALDAIRLRDT